MPECAHECYNYIYQSDRERLKRTAMPWINGNVAASLAHALATGHSIVDPAITEIQVLCTCTCLLIIQEYLPVEMFSEGLCSGPICGW